jgi:glycosyltransferase involved in cell wall biosynthesis
MMNANNPPQGAPAGTTRPTLHGVLVTYRRPAEAAATLARLAEQDRPLDRIVVVDNASMPEVEAAVGEARERGARIEYVPMPENLGFAGGVGAGMEHVMASSEDDDWVVVFDDDDPPVTSTVIGELERFALEMLQRDRRTAIVGVHGGRFDWRRGRISRVPDSELDGAVPLDYVGGNGFPFLRVAALREVGPFSRAIFFGLSEVEHGLRVRRAGYTVYAHGGLWRESRERAGRMGHVMRPRRGLRATNWRQYYTLRNAIYTLREFGRNGTALRLIAVHGVGKPVANVVRSPRLAFEHLRLNWRACRDGWKGRMGRTLEPEPWGRRPGKASQREPAG